MIHQGNPSLLRSTDPGIRIHLPFLAQVKQMKLPAKTYPANKEKKERKKKEKKGKKKAGGWVKPRRWAYRDDRGYLPRLRIEALLFPLILRQF